MNMQAIGLFVVAAIALLGSPGPGIAALLVVGKSQGWSGGLRFYVGLQVGLAAAVAICGAGLVSLLAVYPAVTRVMVIAAAIYLVYLSCAIATSPVGKDQPDRSGTYSPCAGLLLGITNPKAYLAISALLASPLQLTVRETGNIALKIALCIAVILLVDIVWLWIGVAVGRTNLTPFAERIMNVAMGTAILIAMASSL
jgi:threonine/homoserine/homoserine lactone efflux protein